ncbi:hypothetical protein [Rhodococcus sp. GA1]|uniref:hypothetical protein n=1 Tax=Rhodococcus sp. GA1 TaxID=2942275 RepID=UPI0020CFE338|nr:hypothetical protein [Rhodococcus sp. GA1]
MASRTVEESIDLFTPNIPAQLWEEIGPFVRDVVRGGFEPTSVPQVVRGRMGIVASMVGWAVEQGLDLDVEEIFHPATVNRYAVTFPGLSDATRCTRRATLTTLSRRITRTAPWEPPRDLLPYPVAYRPYTDGQTRLLLRWVDRQATVRRSHGMSCVLGLGLGAGLQTSEVLAVTGDDIVRRRSHLAVRVRGTRRRTVPVLERYVPIVADCATRAGRAHLFCEPQPRVEYVSMVLGRCEIPARLRPLRVSRLRATWATAMIQTVPLPVFQTLFGSTDVGALHRLLAFVPSGRRVFDDPELVDLIIGAAPP